MPAATAKAKTESTEKVSTGNSENKEVKTTIARQRTNPDSLIVPVDQLNDTHFKNPRQFRDESEVIDMVHSIRNNGQLQPVVCAQLEDGKLGVAAGWTRMEAFWRIVCEPLIKKWNDEHGLKTKDTALQVSNVSSRNMVCNAYPEDFDKEKTKEKNLIEVVLKPISDAKEAFNISWVENNDRKDLCLLDQILGLERGVSDHGMKAKEVGKMAKLSDAQVSNLRKVLRMINTLPEIMATPDKGEVITESDLVQIKEAAKTMTDTLVGRMKIRPGQAYEGQVKTNIAVSISHLKELSAQVMVKEDSDKEEGEEREKEGEKEGRKETKTLKERMTGRLVSRKQVMEAVALLVGANEKTYKVIGQDDGHPCGVKSPEVFCVFVQRLKDMAAEEKARREGKVVPVKTEGPKDQAAVTGTIEGLAAQQEAGNKEETTPSSADGSPSLPTDTDVDVAVDGEAAASESNADATVAGLASGVSDSAKAASILGAQVPVDTDVDQVSVQDTPKNLETTNRKTQAAPMSQARLKEIPALYAGMMTAMAMATKDEEEESEIMACSIAYNLGSAEMAADALNLSDRRKAIQVAAQTYVQDMETYLDALEEYAVEAFKNKGKGLKVFPMERPTCPYIMGYDDIEAGDEDLGGDDVDPDMYEGFEEEEEMEDSDEGVDEDSI